MTPSKSSPVYRYSLTGGNYKLTYKAESGNQRNGIPVNPGTDIVNLVKLSGSGPDFIVTSEFDFERKFAPVDLITETPTKAPTTKSKASK